MTSAELAKATASPGPLATVPLATTAACTDATIMDVSDHAVGADSGVAEQTKVFVSVAGRVEQIPLAQANLAALLKELEDRFGLDRQSGDLQITSDAEGEHRVLTDQHFRQLVQAKHTLHALVGERVLADVEQRVWQLRQFQSNCFKDGLARLRQADVDMQQEMAQLRMQLEQQTQRQAELANDLLQERNRREAAEQAMQARHDDLASEMRRDLLCEQQSRKASEAELAQSVDEKHQSALCFVAKLEGQTAELRQTLEVQSKRCAESIEEATEKVHKQCEQLRIDIRADFDFLRGSCDTQKENIESEVAKREELEETVAEKLQEILEKIYSLDASCDATRINADRSAVRIVPLEEAASRSHLAIAELQSVNRSSLMSMRCAGQDASNTSAPIGGTYVGPLRHVLVNDTTSSDSRSSSLLPTPSHTGGASALGPVLSTDSPRSLSGSASAALASPTKAGNIVAGRMPPSVTRVTQRPPLARVASAPGLSQNGMHIADALRDAPRGAPRVDSPSRAAAAAAAAAVLLPDGAPTRGLPINLVLTPPTTISNPGHVGHKLSPVSLGSISSPRRHIGVSQQGGVVVGAMQQNMRSQTPTPQTQLAHGVVSSFVGVVPGRVGSGVATPLGAPPPLLGMVPTLSAHPGSNISF